MVCRTSFKLCTVLSFEYCLAIVVDNGDERPHHSSILSVLAHTSFRTALRMYVEDAICVVLPERNSNSQ